MKLLTSATLLSALLLAPMPTLAEGTIETATLPFDELVRPEAPQCVPMNALNGADATVDLTSDQFQFVRAFFAAIPSVSHELPPGDRAIMARSQGRVLIALVSGQEICARFLAPDFVTDMIMKVGEGEIVQAGAGL